MKNQKNPYGYSIKVQNKNSGKYLKDLLEDINANHIKLIADTSVGIVYYFELNYSTEIFNVKLKKGRYILKKEDYDKYDSNERTIQHFLILSNLKLIPKIFFIKQIPKNKNEISIIQIMDFIDAIDLQKLYEEKDWAYNYNDKELRILIWDKILKEYERWKKFSKTHNDLQMKNILLENKNGLKIIFIDSMFIDGDYDVSELERIKKRLLPWEFEL